MKTYLTKLTAALVLATLMMPVLASAETTAGASANIRGEAATPTALMRASQTVLNQATQVQKTATMMAALSLKLSLRIASSTATSSAIAAANALLADLNAQIADAQLQATAAFGHIANATATTSTKLNTTAELAKARADIVVARKDLATARKDLDKLLVAIRVRATEKELHATSSAQVETH